MKRNRNKKGCISEAGGRSVFIIEQKDEWFVRRVLTSEEIVVCYQCPSRNEIRTQWSFQFRNEQFFARSRKSSYYAEAYREYAAQVMAKIDAGIAKKSHLWMETT